MFAMKSPTSKLQVVVDALPFILWVMFYFIARFALEDSELAPWLRVVIALLPVLPFAFCLIFVVSHIRHLDELHRRVHLEALVIAFPLTLLLVMTLGLMELAIGLSPEDWSYRHLLPYLVTFYFLGLAIAWRRYK
jgi:hypothetical protein